MENKNLKSVEAKKENLKDEKVKNLIGINNDIVLKYSGVFLGLDTDGMRTGISKKTGKPYKFGKFTVDVDCVNRDGEVITRRFTISVNDENQMPGEEIEKYSRVVLSFKSPINLLNYENVLMPLEFAGISSF